MLHLRRLGLLRNDVRVVEGTTLGERLDAWEASERRRALPDDPGRPRLRPGRGDLRPRSGASRRDARHGRLPDRQPGSARVGGQGDRDRPLDARRRTASTSSPARRGSSPTEHEAIEAIKDGTVQAGEVIALIGCGPAGTGMEETYQLTSALKHVPFGRQVALLTDARFSGVSTGACIGHVGPEALAGGPVGRLRTGDLVRVRVDTRAADRIARLPRPPRRRAHARRKVPSNWHDGEPTPRPAAAPRAARPTPGCGRRCRRSAAAPGAAASTTSTPSWRGSPGVPAAAAG